MYAVAITTVDNPFDPFDEFDSWLWFDEKFMHHGTMQTFARIAVHTPSLSPQDSQILDEMAIDRMVEMRPNFYKKVKKELKE